MRPETEPWFRQGHADLDTARVLLESSRYYAASWFAQQAAEKGLKALFIEVRGLLAPRTHDLEFLGRQLELPREIEADLMVLTPAFDLARYPDPTSGSAPIDRVTAGQATDHVAAAERVLKWIEVRLQDLSTQP
jgi:HEPN domain-containing protein